MQDQPDLSDLLQSEAAKRDRNWNPQERWRVIQQTIAWSEMQSTVRRNTKAACLANQARVLAGLAEYQASLSR